MSPIIHFLTGWVLADCAGLERRDRALVTLACVVPDVDGLGIVPELLTRPSQHPLLLFSRYHHALHNLGFALLVMALAWLLARRKSKTAFLALISFHLHLMEDLLGSRGPDGDQWPIPYLMPFSSRLQLVWQGQWALNAWPNFLITLLLLMLTLELARRHGHSPMEMLSENVDRKVIGAIRQRFPI